MRIAGRHGECGVILHLLVDIRREIGRNDSCLHMVNRVHLYRNAQSTFPPRASQ